MSVENAIRKDRSELANALSDGVDYIAIVSDSYQNRRVLLISGIEANTEEQKLADAKYQCRNKSEPWESLQVLLKLVKVPLGF